MYTIAHFNQAQAWFLKIAFGQEVGACVCVCMCVCVYTVQLTSKLTKNVSNDSCLEEFCI